MSPRSGSLSLATRMRSPSLIVGSIAGLGIRYALITPAALPATRTATSSPITHATAIAAMASPLLSLTASGHALAGELGVREHVAGERGEGRRVQLLRS